MQTLTLVYFNAGGGHRAAAQALAEVMAQQQRPWRVELVNLVDIIDPQGLFRRCTGMAPEDLYNKRLASGFTLGLAQELKLLQGLIRVSHGALVQRLHRHWLQTQPDAVVSLIPNFNRALAESVAAARPGTPFVTVMTDMADHPPHFWAEPGTAQHLVCGTAHAAQQALAAGLPAAQVHRAAGMILRPAFHDAAVALARTPEHRAEARRAVGLDPVRPTGLVLFGGTGSLAMKRIAQRLPDTPLILMCGRNAALAQALRALPAPASGAARVVVEFTPEVARWMALADFFIGKPGPGSLSEAVHMGLPVIVTRNAGTMPQERWNTDWVRQHGLGLVLRSFAHIAPAVADLQQRLPELQANARAMPNRALYEVPEIIQGLLQPAAAPPPRAAAPALQAVESPA